MQTSGEFAAIFQRNSTFAGKHLFCLHLDVFRKMGTTVKGESLLQEIANYKLFFLYEQNLIREVTIDLPELFPFKMYPLPLNIKGSIFLKSRHFIIQERFNKLIYGINQFKMWHLTTCKISVFSRS